MGWNGPGEDKNPWKGGNQPPDLDAILKRLQARVLAAFKTKKTTGFTSAQSGEPSGAGLLFALGFAVLLLLWFLAGFFIVDPAEKAAILRLGKYVETVGPGPHWIPRILESKRVLNVDRVADYSYSAQMLTKDENLVSVSLAVQYRIGDLEEYLFNVADPEESLRQATSSALRQVVGQTTLDKIITEGREAWGSSVQESLVKILDLYKTGIVIVNVSPQPARAPENVQEAFDDAIKAQEDERRYKEQARAYEAKVVPIAEGNAKRILAEAQAESSQVVLRAEGDTAEFLRLLPEFNRAPQLMSQRMYLEAMQRILTATSKILVNSKAQNMLYLPLDKILANAKQDKTAALPSLSKGTANSPEDANTDFDGRDFERSNPRLGRN